MERLPLSVNGKDFSSLANAYGYTVNYEPVYGPNATAVMQDGTELIDLLGWRTVVTVSCNDLETAKQAELLTACLAAEVELEYFDTRLNADTTATFTTSVSGSSIKLYDVGDVRIFGGLSIVFRSKGVFGR